MTTQTEVLVLGAGPAGLGAAYRLARAGHSVVVLERNEHVGGLAGSFEVAGMRVDFGSHRLHPATDPAVLTELRTLLGDDLQQRRRHGRIRVAGSFVGFPPRPLDLVRALPPRLATRLARDVMTAPLRRARSDTFAEIVRASLGPTMLRTFYGPYARKLWDREPEALDGELARRRVGARRTRDLLRKTLRRGERGNMFWYPRRGYGQITDVLADAAIAAGARIECATTVDRLELGATAIAGAGSREWRAGTVWSTLPLPALAGLAGGPAVGLAFRALVLVYLVLPQQRWTEFDAHYFPELAIPISRISEPRNYRDSLDDPRDCTVLCAEWPCTVGDPVWGADASVLGAEVRASLAREGLAMPSPVHVEVRRIAHAYPVYDLTFAARFAALDGWARGLEPRVLTFGRQGLFAHDNAHHALEMAWSAAGCMDGAGAFDRLSWRAARRRFDAHVVED